MDNSDSFPQHAQHVSFDSSSGELSPELFWADPVAERSREVSPVFVQRFRGSLAEAEPTFHSDWEIIAIRRGHGKLHTIPRRRLEPNHVYLLPPGLWHREQARQVELFWIGVQGTRLGGLDRTRSAQVESELVLNFAERLWEAAEQRRVNSGPELDGLAHAIVGHLIYALTKRPDELDLLDVIIGEIRRHYAHITSTVTLAQRFGLSEGHFYRRFKQRLGVTPLQFLTEVRLQAAEALLARGGHSVSESARAVGFDDPLYFSRVYRKRRGIAPSSGLKGRGRH